MKSIKIECTMDVGDFMTVDESVGNSIFITILEDKSLAGQRLGIEGMTRLRDYISSYLEDNDTREVRLLAARAEVERLGLLRETLLEKQNTSRRLVKVIEAEL